MIRDAVGAPTHPDLYLRFYVLTDDDAAAGLSQAAGKLLSALLPML